MTRAWFSAELETVATFWRVTRRDGVALGFTDANLLDDAPPEVDLILAGDVCYLYISPGFASSWESDRLGEDQILWAGDSTTLSLPAGDYDVLARNCDEETLATQTATVAPAAVIALTG